MIKLFVTDVDGTMTDGGVYYSMHGEEMVKFNRKDGLGFHYLKEAQIPILVMSGEENPCARQRCEKLNVDYVMLGVLNKKERLEQFLLSSKLDWKEIAYIGDDVNDLDCLRKAGYAACPNDSASSVQEIKGIYICQCPGGQGAVREWAEYCLAVNQSQQRKSFSGVGQNWRG
jgi:YrbI family 3-deoxy-D-manno-octulosonate 8-phosphate phosphatase